MKNLKVSISKGNSKMGSIPSVSLPPCTTCNPNAPCFKKCYAVKIQRLYKTVKTAYENNLDTELELLKKELQHKEELLAVHNFYRTHLEQIKKKEGI